MKPERFSELAAANASRFWAKVKITPGCWLWTGGTDGRGYGKFKLAPYESARAHRVAYAAAKGTIPEGVDVLHACDNPACCNPAHLSLGTHAENMADMARKGRSAGGGAPGDANQNAKLTQAQAVEIKSRLRAGARTSILAREYGVTDSMISRIKTGKAWTHV